nr:MAG TPA: hypothetical protein [Caudoviricetes sp.]
MRAYPSFTPAVLSCCPKYLFCNIIVICKFMDFI